MARKKKGSWSGSALTGAGLGGVASIIASKGAVGVATAGAARAVPAFILGLGPLAVVGGLIGTAWWLMRD